MLSAPDVAAIVRENSLGAIAHEPSRLLVTVLTDPADRRQLLLLLQRDWAPEALAIGSRAAYLWCPGGTIKSPLVAAVNRVVADRATSRNWTTITKLHALVEPAIT